MHVRLLGIKIGETCVLCCNYNKQYWERSKQLRYQEAFWTLRWWVRVLVLFNIITLTFNRDFDYDCPEEFVGAKRIKWAKHLKPCSWQWTFLRLEWNVVILDGSFAICKFRMPIIQTLQKPCDSCGLNSIERLCKMTREQLFDAMVNRKPVYINGIRHLLNGMEMEDGSGYAFNLKLCSNDFRGTNGQIFYRTAKHENPNRLRKTAYHIEIGWLAHGGRPAT
mgnify:CR=1 FL=1